MPIADPERERVRTHLPLLHAWVLSDLRPLDLEMFETDEHLMVEDARRGPWKKVEPGTRWGKPWSTAWFRLTASVPKEWAGRTVVLRWLSGQGLLFRGGVPWQGLDEQHQLAVLADPAKGGERETVLIESGASGLFGRFPGPLAVEHAHLAVWNREFERVAWEMEALLDICDELPVEHPLRRQTLRALGRALEAIDRVLRFPKGPGIEPRFVGDAKSFGETPEAPPLETLATPEEISAAAEAARRELAAVQQPAKVPHLPTLWAVGHAHIDLAWLWPLAETVRKCGRTWATQLRLIEEFPDYLFVASQGCEYAYVKERYPTIYQAIQDKVRAGRWEPLISMWVESDCIVNGGESLVRQFLWGIRFSEREFGAVHDVVWLPDAFGYCVQMPQILKRCGLRYFMTTKLWWNDTNPPPMTSFWWRGLDGTRILTHFPNNYNNAVRGGDLLRYLQYNREPDIVKDLLFIYGHGDGGGGPSRKMVHLATTALKNQQGLPPVKCAPALDFFRRLERAGPDLPTWVGEHYNEFHRGTYTTQARTKRGNRLGEAALREAELWSVAARVSTGAETPRPTLDAAWERLLHNQFHDILPGSSIGHVYELAHRDYAQIQAQAAEVRAGALAAIAATVNTAGEGKPVIVFNPSSWPRTDLVSLPATDGRQVVGPDGAALLQQVVKRDQVTEVLFLAADVPACGYATYRLGGSAPGSGGGTADMSAGEMKVSAGKVETPFYSVTLDQAGRFTRLFDKRSGREVLPEGSAGNAFLFFSDLSSSLWNDAWDINEHYRRVFRELTEPAEVTVLEKGPLRAVIRVKHAFSHSTLDQDIRFYAHSPRIDFVTAVDWHEQHKLLKVSFPVDLRNPRATYEVQFGHLERPIHRNTSWEQARFEVPAQKWADLGEPGYGMALLNDGRHGYDAANTSSPTGGGQGEGVALRLTLLRAPKAPDANADQGRHEFTYSILPHAGDFRQAGVIQAAYALAFPLRAVAAEPHGGPLPARHGWLAVEPAGVVVEAVKPAEEGEGFIIRLYESHGARAEAVVKLHVPVEKIEEVDLIERRVAAVKVKNGAVRFTIQPFEIRTLRVTPIR